MKWILQVEVENVERRVMTSLLNGIEKLRKIALYLGDT
jgi:hypothetical protein